MLQKTLLNIEGLGRHLDPELDLWTTAKPYLERWMDEQIGWRGLVRTSSSEAPQLGEPAAAAAAPGASRARRGPPKRIEDRLDALVARGAAAHADGRAVAWLLAVCAVAAFWLVLRG